MTQPRTVADPLAQIAQALADGAGNVTKAIEALAELGRERSATNARGSYSADYCIARASDLTDVLGRIVEIATAIPRSSSGGAGNMDGGSGSGYTRLRGDEVDHSETIFTPAPGPYDDAPRITPPIGTVAIFHPLVADKRPASEPLLKVPITEVRLVKGGFYLDAWTTHPHAGAPPGSLGVIETPSGYTVHKLIMPDGLPATRGIVNHETHLQLFLRVVDDEIPDDGEGGEG